jgi:hypothetical protein
MKHKAKLLFGTLVILSGGLIYQLWGSLRSPPGFLEDESTRYVGIITMLIFGGFVIVYYFVFRKWELERGSEVLSFKVFRNANLVSL